MSLLQLSGTDSSSGSSAYWSANAPQKKHTGMAIASLVFGILAALMPLFLCSSSVYLITHEAVLVSLILMVPPTLAVIFGHIGKHHANTVHGLGEPYSAAVAGLVLGYLFGFIYLAFCLMLLLWFL